MDERDYLRAALLNAAAILTASANFTSEAAVRTAFELNELIRRRATSEQRANNRFERKTNGNA